VLPTERPTTNRHSDIQLFIVVHAPEVPVGVEGQHEALAIRVDHELGPAAIPTTQSRSIPGTPRPWQFAFDVGPFWWRTTSHCRKQLSR
jgi:hypothetical protein